MNENPSSEALGEVTRDVDGEDLELDGMDGAEEYRLKVRQEYYNLLRGSQPPTDETLDIILGLSSPSRERLFIEYALARGDDAGTF